MLHQQSTKSRMNRSNEEIEELGIRIDEILFYKWDPLNLSNSTWARDEYRSYVPKVLRLALESKSYHPIADHLSQIAAEAMRMDESRQHHVRVAKLIFFLANEQSFFPDHVEFIV